MEIIQVHTASMYVQLSLLASWVVGMLERACLNFFTQLVTTASHALGLLLAAYLTSPASIFAHFS